jgi:phosphatidylinositol alpha-mannosyltransferase
VHRVLPLMHSNKIVHKFLPAITFAAQSFERFDILHFHGDDYLVKGSNRRVRTFYGSAFFEAIYARSFFRKMYQVVFYCFELFSCFKKGILVGISPRTAIPLPLVKTIIPCGIDLVSFPDVCFKSDTPLLLAIGELYGRKRTIDVINAFVNTLLPHNPTARLALVGPSHYSKPSLLHCLFGLGFIAVPAPMKDLEFLL